ncbi:hypothetical protein ACWERF_18490 [Streptomyces griseoluteus]
MAAAAFLAATAAPLIGATAAHAQEGGACSSVTVQYRLVGADGKVVAGRHRPSTSRCTW